MTIITGLKYEVVETTEPFGRVIVRSFSLDGYKSPPIKLDSIRCQEYSISGRRICTPNGKEVFLGNAPEVEEFLGLQFDLFDNLKREKEKALDELRKAEEREEAIRNNGLFTRLKYLFTGELL
jgi:hypothetical protein